MSALSWKQAKREQVKRRLDNATAAMLLDTVGMDVLITLDDGSVLRRKLESLPWTTGDGLYLAQVEGIRGGYDCARIAPAGKSEKAREILERSTK